MRKLIAGMKMTLDGKVEGSGGIADWYEQYWTGIRNEPDKVAWITGKPPTAAEIEYARFAARTPHYVLSNTLTSASWSITRFIKGFDEVAALKEQQGKGIYLVGGARTAASLIDAGLVDELRLIVSPLVAGDGKSLFATVRRRGLELQDAKPAQGGRVKLTYGIG